MIEVEGGLSLQQDNGDREQPVGDATEGTTVRVAACTQGIVATAAFGVVLHGGAGPVEHGLGAGGSAPPTCCTEVQREEEALALPPFRRRGRNSGVQGRACG